MSRSQGRNSETSILVVILIVCLGFISIVQQCLQHQYKIGTIRDYPALFHSPHILKSFSFNFSDLLADMIWIRCVRYIYHHYHLDNNYPYLYDFLNQIVVLSPKFIDAYILGAENLLIVSNQPELAIKLLEDGIENNPENWLLYFKLGQCYHLGLQDMDKGYAYYRIAARYQGTPDYLFKIVDAIDSGAENNRITRRIWELIYETTTMKNLKRSAKTKMLQVAIRD